MAPVNRLAPQGLDGLGHGPERLLGSLGDHTGGQIAISDRVVEIARASADASTAVEAVPSSDRAPISNMVSAPGTAQLARVLVHPLFLSLFFSPPSLLFPSQPSVATLHNPDDSSFASILLSSSLFFFFYSVIRPSATSSRFPIPLHSFSFYFHLIFFLSSLRTFIQIGMLYTIDARPIRSCYGGRGWREFPASVETNSNFRVRFFFFGSVPMNFCEPGFGSIPVGWRGFNKVYGD